MYYVYKIEIGQFVYVGCTNFLRRRKDQHNENARKKKSKFGRFLSDNGIVLNLSDLQVLYQLEDRKEALKIEKETTIKYEKMGMILLNDNYSKSCSRKGKNIGHTSKEYVIVDMYNHSATTIRDLRQYGMKIGVCYKDLHHTLSGDYFCQKRYKAFTPKEWKSTKDKDLYLSGKIIEVRNRRVSQTMAKYGEKSYLVLTPNDEVIKVTNLDAFAREHGINAGNLHNSYNHPIRRACGYKVIKRI